MNTVVTSRESILNVSRELVRTQGWKAVNIRTVAEANSVSVGTIYNYFNTKSDLITAIVESIWHDIFHHAENINTFDSFINCVEWIFNCMEKGNQKYPDFFILHSMSLLGEEKSNGKYLMAQSWNHIKNGFSIALANDRNIRSDIFDEVFTEKQFIDIIFSLVISSLLQQNYDCSGISEMICRLIY